MEGQSETLQANVVSNARKTEKYQGKRVYHQSCIIHCHSSLLRPSLWEYREKLGKTR